MIGGTGLLRTSEVFARATDEDLATIADHIDERRVRVGAPLVKQGQPADTLFVVVSGELAVHVAHGDEVEEVARMVPGDVIGEIALVAGGTRTSTVRATATSRVVSLTKEGLELLVSRRPDIGDRTKGPDFRRKEKTVGCFKIVKRLDTKRVSGQQKLFQLVVPDGKCKHPDHSVQNLKPPNPVPDQ